MYPSVSPWNQWLHVCVIALQFLQLENTKRRKGISPPKESRNIPVMEEAYDFMWKKNWLHFAPPMGLAHSPEQTVGFPASKPSSGPHVSESGLMEACFPCCQEKFRYRWGHWEGTKLRQKVTMVWWPAAIKSKFVVPGTISVAGLNHCELCFCHCELNSPCLMQVTLIYSELSVAWMLRRKL